MTDAQGPIDRRLKLRADLHHMGAGLYRGEPLDNDAVSRALNEAAAIEAEAGKGGENGTSL